MALAQAKAHGRPGRGRGRRRCVAVDEELRAGQDRRGVGRGGRVERAQIQSMQVDQNGEVTVTVVVEANTLLIRRIPATRDYGMQHGTEVATTSLVNH